jgi:hypothetical protein
MNVVELISEPNLNLLMMMMQLMMMMMQLMMMLNI